MLTKSTKTNVMVNNKKTSTFLYGAYSNRPQETNEGIYKELGLFLILLFKINKFPLLHWLGLLYKIYKKDLLSPPKQ